MPNKLTPRQQDTLARAGLVLVITATLALTIWRSHTNPWGYALPPEQACRQPGHRHADLTGRSAPAAACRQHREVMA